MDILGFTLVYIYIHMYYEHVYGRARFDVPCFRAGKKMKLNTGGTDRSDAFAIWTDPFAKIHMRIHIKIDRENLIIC